MRSSFSLFLFTTSGFEPPYWLSGKLVLTLPSCSLPYLAQVIKAFLLTPSEYEMAAERMV